MQFNDVITNIEDPDVLISIGLNIWENYVKSHPEVKEFDPDDVVGTIVSNYIRIGNGSFTDYFKEDLDSMSIVTLDDFLASVDEDTLDTYQATGNETSFYDFLWLEELLEVSGYPIVYSWSSDKLLVYDY